MENTDVKQYENACNEIFPGLQMFVRDVLLDKETEEKYKIGKIIREPTFCDASCRVGGLLTTHRYAILSNHFVSLEVFEHETNWGLFVCKRDSLFKILDVYKLNGKTQIALLHLGSYWKLFENSKSNIEEDIVKMCRERFQNKIVTPPIPELATTSWLKRLIYPIGVDSQNDYHPLHGKIMNEENPETVQSIKHIDEVIEKALFEQRIR